MNTTTRLGTLDVSPIGYGCMALTDIYGGGVTDDDARASLNEAVDAGITLLDTADVYGEPPSWNHTGPAGTNEEMLAPLLAERRDEVQISTKFGIAGEAVNPDTGKIESQGLNGRPEYVQSACEASLRRLGVETIDLYYLHRPDPEVPLEDTIGAMASLVDQGKVRQLGVSELTADEIRRAHATHPIAALQSEWSVWSRDIEDTVVPTCAELGVGVVPYSPLGRGFLTGTLSKEAVSSDVRGDMERMASGWDDNERALALVADVAEELGATNSQVCLAWLLAKGARYGVNTVPIPGSRKASRMIENLGGAELLLTDSHVASLDKVAGLVIGTRSIHADDPTWVSSGRE